MKRYASVIFPICLLLHLSDAKTISAQTDPIDSYVQAEMKSRSIPGLALVVVKNGDIVKMKGYGFANLEHDAPVTPDTVFELASVSKHFTATAIMLLVEQGKVKLDDPINRYLPASPEPWKAITVRHLLTHTAGLPAMAKGFNSLREGGWRADYTTAQMFESAVKDPMSFAPGENWQYSDVGYFLLGMIIEKASGVSYRNFLAQHFFQPIGMASTSVTDLWTIVKNRAAGYTTRGDRLVNGRRVVQFELPSAGGVWSTVGDLTKWDNALAAGKVVKPSSLEQMWTPVKLNNGGSYVYGFGWVIDEKRGHRMITHTGVTGTEYTRFPDHKLTVIVLTNLHVPIGRTTSNAWGLTKGVAGHFIPDFLLNSLKEQPGMHPELTQKLRELLSKFSKREDSPLITPGLRAILSPNTGGTLSRRLEELQSFNFLTCDEIKGRVFERLSAQISRICYYKMVTKSETRYYTFALTSDDKVADFWSSAE